MKQSLIRFTRKDAGRLSYAVREFNKKISELEGLERKYAPEPVTYSDIKSRIITRREFNRIIKSLRRFKKEGQESLVTIGDNIISKWEKHEVNLSIKRAVPRMYQELNQAYKTYPLARFGIKSEEISRLEGNIRNLENLENLKGVSFKDAVKRAKIKGMKDYDLYEQSLYMTNYLKGLKDKDVKNFKNYDKFMNYIKNLRPDEFYNLINKSTIMSDFFIWYDSEKGEVYSGFLSNEDAFNTGLEQLGIVV